MANKTHLEQVPEESSVVIVINFFESSEGSSTLVVPYDLSWTLRDEQGNVVNERSGVSLANVGNEASIVLSGNDLTISADYPRILYLLVEGFYDSIYALGVSFKKEIPFKVVNVVGVT